MKRIHTIRQKECHGGVIAELCGNHAVEEVIVVLQNPTGGHLWVQYAQNNILSELIPLEEYVVTATQTEYTVHTKVPISASHIFVKASEEGIRIQKIVVYEQENAEAVQCYPQVQDTELSENYYLDTISVFFPSEGYFHYSIYTSLDDKNYTFLAKKADDTSCDTQTGDVYSADGREARFIRVLVEYHSLSPTVGPCEIQFTGRASGTPLQNCEEPKIAEFAVTEYAAPITEADTYAEVYGIVTRCVGKAYAAWFEFQLAENPKGHDYDFFAIKEHNHRICITGNNGVSLATGFHYYLKYFCFVNISQVGRQVKMPKALVFPDEVVFRETKARVRYAYNYCTMSYTMAFWGEEEWRAELDRLALNGVNAVLDLTAQEEVWRRFLCGLGYTHKEIKNYIAGPAYYAWAYMSNMFGYGGPIHDTWFAKRTELARKNHRIMHSLGMQPILQGYSGMIPPDILRHDKEASVIPQGTWCSFTRPYMIKTTSKTFPLYAEMFYQAQKEVYGEASYLFATDPFHEGGMTEGVSMRDVAKEVMKAMRKANPQAIWVIQSWQGNPSSELLDGIAATENGREHALVLDLYAEKTPNYSKGNPQNESYGYSREFNHTPWVFCMLNNFGGRCGMHGHLDNLVRKIPEVFCQCEKIVGIGITPEACFNNPILYDFFFESVWQKDATLPLREFDIQNWLDGYCIRRYGAESVSARKAWEILKDTVYRAEYNQLGQGAPESVLNARPSFQISAASAWGNAVVSYPKSEPERAAKLLLADYEKLKQSEGYQYDLVTVVQQVLSNRAQDCYHAIVACRQNRDRQGFETLSEQFLAIADAMETVLACNRHYLLGSWLKQAEKLAAGTDDFTKRMYRFNAKALITTWGSWQQSETGQLHDYSNRQWAGLIGGFYKKRWERFFATVLKSWDKDPDAEPPEWFAWEWNWVWDETVYPSEAKFPDMAVFQKILENEK